MFHLLTVTALNLPRATRGAGVLLALGLAAIHAAVAAQTAAPAYVAGLLLVACAGAAGAGLALLAGLRRVGWSLALAVAGACFVGYLASRAMSWPGFAATTWHIPLGTLALTLEVALGALYLSLLVGTNVDVVGARDWQTYFSRPRHDQVGVLRG